MSALPLPRRPVVMLGLDAFDPVLLREWVAAGALPAFAQILERGAFWTLGSSAEWLQGSIWPSFATGCDPDHHGMYFLYQPRDDGHRLRRMRARDLAVEPFWLAACRAGRRAVVVDVPKAPLAREPRLVQVVEYGAMDHYAHFATHPPDLARRVLQTCGDHVLRRPFRAPLDRRDEDRLLADLLRGISAKRSALEHLLTRERPDLAVCVLGEAHAAGHHLWARHERALASARDDEDPLRAVYVALDALLGDLLSRVAGRANLLVFSGHGMERDERPHGVLDDVLAHLGALVRRGARPHRPPAERRTEPGLLRRADARLRQAFKASAPAWLADRIHLLLQQPRGIDRRRSIAWSLPSDHQGFVRINLRGREPFGLVDPAVYGRTVDALCEQLLALRNTESGMPVVDRVAPLRRRYGEGARRDGLPDIAVCWRNEPVRELLCPRNGPLRVSPSVGRLGNHRLAGFCVGLGPDFPWRGEAGHADLRDLAATALDLLQVPHAPGMPGQSLATRRNPPT